jgi:hypothetical protein
MSVDNKDKKTEQNESDNKVVPFPTHKIRKPKAENSVEAPTNLPPGISPARRKTLVVSLLSIMIVATLIATKVNLNHDAVRADRDLASVEPQRRDLNEDLMLAKKISRQSLRSPASRGREPTAEEILSHVELASAYAIQYDKDGALRSIEFAKQPGAQPRRLAAPESFLKEHQDLFRLSFDNVQKSESIRDNEFLTEIYELRNKNVEVAKVHFKFQNDQELNLMKVELTEDTKRNPTNAN